ncbi:TPA: hypothetical protein IVO84_000341 [Enterococcus faecium]|uniref:Uncharacterized protein n=5 Tax=Enterococcus faecium TaxID=1352 RepID=A0A132Z5U8_ENTFC|nr:MULTISPECIES: hypothetical protein [Enterococcus]HCD2005262.1 hypothetical protein [Enterococcus faecalis]AYF52769.1 hypothetical protein [Enterococcus faecium]EJX56261.1 hypothetical protein HMPREF1378_00080 [Enterococcus faecium R496]EKQ3345658.1 hypothetical protein [Enterococcus faecium]EKQ3703515.1 hypothetical protein [Enterococcus faecium]
MVDKEIKGEIRLFQRENDDWGTEISKNLAEDIELRLSFISMIIESFAFELGIPQEKLAEILIKASNNSPQHFHIDLGTVN